jgi:hypothetical protein
MKKNILRSQKEDPISLNSKTLFLTALKNNKKKLCNKIAKYSANHNPPKNYSKKAFKTLISRNSTAKTSLLFKTELSETFSITLSKDLYLINLSKIPTITLMKAPRHPISAMTYFTNFPLTRSSL